MMMMQTELELTGVARWLVTSGTIAILSGIVVLLWPGPTILVLTGLVGFAVVVIGLAFVIVAVRYREESPAWRLRVIRGLVAVATGIAIWVWPDATVRTVAILLGLSVLAVGIADLSISLVWRRLVPGWHWLFGAGTASVVTGLIILMWPEISISVLAMLAGGYCVVFGAVGVSAGWRLKRSIERAHFSEPLSLFSTNVVLDADDLRPQDSHRNAPNSKATS